MTADDDRPVGDYEPERPPAAWVAARAALLLACLVLGLGGLAAMGWAFGGLREADRNPGPFGLNGLTPALATTAGLGGLLVAAVGGVLLWVTRWRQE